MEEATSLLDKIAEAAKPRPLEPVEKEQDYVSKDTETPASKAFRKNEDITVYDFLKNFSGGPPLRISLIRIAPAKWEGQNIEGLIATYDDFIDEDFIQENFGGGKYQIKVSKDRGNGQYVYAGAKTCKIAGNPKPQFDSPKLDSKDIPISSSDDTVRAALTMAQNLTRDAIDRADRVELRPQGPIGIAPEILPLLLEPLKLQVQTLNAQLAEKDRIIVEKDKIINDLSNKKPDTMFQDTIVGKLIDNESTKLEAVRMQHESERRQLVQSYADEIKRIQDRQDYELRRIEDAHKRELQHAVSSVDVRIESLKNGYEGRLEAKDNRIKDLERDLTRYSSELIELRAKKDKGPLENIKDMIELKENMAALGMGNDEAEEPSVFDKALEMAAPLVAGIGKRLEGQSTPVPQEGQVKRRIIRAVPKKTGEQTQAQTEQTKQLEGLNLDSVEVAAAVTFMETGLRNGTSPENFAQSVRNMVPMSVLNALKEKGVDTFLDQIANNHIQVSSPLTTQVGRTWIRKVVRYLLTESTDEPTVS